MSRQILHLLSANPNESLFFAFGAGELNIFISEASREMGLKCPDRGHWICIFVLFKLHLYSGDICQYVKLYFLFIFILYLSKQIHIL